MPTSEKRQQINRRVRPHDEVWLQILEKANYSCEWEEDGIRCGLEDGQIDPIGGGTVKLTSDHKVPHSMNVETDSGDPNQWRVLCGRHQVMKKNFWDDSTGKINVYAIVQAANEQEKRIVFSFLVDYFGYQINDQKLERVGMTQMTFAELDDVTRNNGNKKSNAVILPPMDIFESIELIKSTGIKPRVTMLDPWYNKGFGEIRPDYNDFVISILEALIGISDHVFLWGFPEIVAQYFNRIPTEYQLVAWLTWYYKNNPSVIRGWRSSQNACLHLSQGDAKLYPEHFLNDAQKEKLEAGKLRYMPGPTSVIEAALLVGFVGKDEQTGHPSQKPLKVYEPLLFMTTKENDLIYDPMCGSGTTGVFALKHNRASILSDINEEYISIVESRLLEERIHPNKTLPSTFSAMLQA